MALIIVSAPLGPVAVNPGDVFCIVPEPHNPAQAEIRYDSNRHVLATESAETIVNDLGGDFRKLPAASLDFDRAWINSALVTSVVPHPQTPDVCFVMGTNSKIAVKGDLSTIVKALK